jgi:hypothetical protein
MRGAKKFARDFRGEDARETKNFPTAQEKIR